MRLILLLIFIVSNLPTLANPNIKDGRFIELQDARGNKVQVSIIPIEDTSDLAPEDKRAFKAITQGLGEDSISIFNFSPSDRWQDSSRDIAEQLGFADSEVVSYKGPETQLSVEQKELLESIKTPKYMEGPLKLYKKGGRALLTTFKFITYGGLTIMATSLANGGGINVFEPFFDPNATVESIKIAKASLIYGGIMASIGSLMTYFNQEFGDFIEGYRFEKPIRNALKKMGIDVKKQPESGILKRIKDTASFGYLKFKWLSIETLFVYLSNMAKNILHISIEPISFMHTLTESLITTGTQGTYDKVSAGQRKIDDLDKEVIERKLSDASTNEQRKLLQDRLDFIEEFENKLPAGELEKKLDLYIQFQKLKFDGKILLGSKIWAISNVLYAATGNEFLFIAGHGSLLVLAAMQADWLKRVRANAVAKWRAKKSARKAARETSKQNALSRIGEKRRILSLDRNLKSKSCDQLLYMFSQAI